MNRDRKPYYLSVKAVILDDSRRCLMLRRSNDSKHNPLRWDFPGGKVDLGEPVGAGLIREVLEETALGVTLCQVLGAAESELPDRRVAYLFFGAEIRNGSLRLSPEHDEAAWLIPAEIQDSSLCPQYREFVRSLERR